VIRPGEQQQVHRAEEQEGRILARPSLTGQVKQLIGSRHRPAQAAVQR
jgi:hypothetical protein